jgi:hypothetical protein
LRKAEAKASAFFVPKARRKRKRRGILFEKSLSQRKRRKNYPRRDSRKDAKAQRNAKGEERGGESFLFFFGLKARRKKKRDLFEKRLTQRKRRKIYPRRASRKDAKAQRNAKGEEENLKILRAFVS